MEQTVNATEARIHFGELMQQAADKGEPIIVERDGKAHVVIALPAAYDAHYLAVAEHLGAAFWTADRALAHAVQPELNWVHLAIP